MARPKSSWVGVGDLATDAYTAVKVRNMRGEIDHLQRAHAAGTAMTLSAIGTLAEMNFALGIQMAECDAKLQTLTDISWKIADYFDRKEIHEAIVGTMRFSIHTMNRELDDIDGISEEYPEYALVMTDRLVAVIEKRDVRVEHFSQISMEEMRLAQELLDRVDSTRRQLISRLEGSDGD